jgi:hypothetical protein
MSLSPATAYGARGVKTLLVAYRMKRTVAYCGCPSQRLLYSIVESLTADDQVQEYERVFGRIAPREAQGELEFVLATDGVLPSFEHTKLRLRCAAPD